MQTLLIFFIDVPQLKGFAQDVHVQQAFFRQFRAGFNPLPGNQIDVKYRWQVQNTGHKSKVTGHRSQVIVLPIQKVSQTLVKR